MTIKRLEAKPTAPFWNLSVPALLARLQSQAQGLSLAEADVRLKRYGQNRLHNHQAASPWHLLLAQFKRSIILISMNVLCSDKTG